MNRDGEFFDGQLAERIILFVAQKFHLAVNMAVSRIVRVPVQVVITEITSYRSAPTMAPTAEKLYLPQSSVMVPY